MSISEFEMSHLLAQPPIMCDICNKQVSPNSEVWTCENGRRTVLHSVAYDVCQLCFERHARGMHAAPEDDEDEDDEEDFSDSDCHWTCDEDSVDSSEGSDISDEEEVMRPIGRIGSC